MSDILVQSFELMVLGMGFVFLFLVALVYATTAMSSVAMKYFPDPLPKAVIPKTLAPKAKAQIDPTTMAVITAAIKQHRSRHKK